MAHAKLGDTLGAVETALVLHHYTSIKVPFVDKCVHDALLAIVDFYGANMPACHHNDRWASLAGMAVVGQVQRQLLVIEIHLKCTGICGLPDEVLGGEDQP